jgi:hypothetical protein
MAQINTCIPKTNLFRFENFWVEQQGFFEIVEAVWNTETNSSNSVARVSAKLKLLRKALKRWSKNLSQLNKLIQECNTVIAILDKLEEQRPLFIQENNFRKIIKAHTLKLLQCKKEYWKKRYTIRWTKFGDESTGFFHAAATERYRQNTITSLQTPDERTITDHYGKATLLWQTYKYRMGQSLNPTMAFDLANLVHRSDDLEHLSEPFTKDEMDAAVQRMPTDKAPGPDGFNGMFIKKCWHIIKEDIYELCNDFFNVTVSLEEINSFFKSVLEKQLDSSLRHIRSTRVID